MVTRIMHIGKASHLPRGKKREFLKTPFDDSGLDEQKRTGWKGETTRLASIFGGTATY
jgi:hypothetical protein